LAEGTAVDPVTAEVIRGAMETVCWEMATYVSRTATTPILNQSNERNGSILDAKGASPRFGGDPAVHAVERAADSLRPRLPR
jgi:N-methylhydantoinase B/acetone carboxylase, alpha subunit